MRRGTDGPNITSPVNPKAAPKISEEKPERGLFMRILFGKRPRTPYQKLRAWLLYIVLAVLFIPAFVFSSLAQWQPGLMVYEDKVIRTAALLFGVAFLGGGSVLIVWSIAAWVKQRLFKTEK